MSLGSVRQRPGRGAPGHAQQREPVRCPAGTSAARSRASGRCRIDRHADREDDRRAELGPDRGEPLERTRAHELLLERVSHAVDGADESRLVRRPRRACGGSARRANRRRGRPRSRGSPTRGPSAARGENTTPGSRASVARISNSSGVSPISPPSTATRRRLGSTSRPSCDDRTLRPGGRACAPSGGGSPSRARRARGG